MEIKDLAGLSEPITRLIDKISDATGVLYEPKRIVRRAKAEAKAHVIAAQADIEASDLRRRALMRLVDEEAKKQENMEAILDLAVPQITNEAKPDNMDDDWLVNFFDKGKTISNEEAQKVWAKIISSETNSPGSFSKRTVNTLHSLDKIDIIKFENLCRFTWRTPDLFPIIFNIDDDVYKNNDLTFINIMDLEELGLVHYDPVNNYQLRNRKGHSQLYYFERIIGLYFGDDDNKSLDIGNLILTQTGRELAKLTNVDRVDGYYEYVAQKWKKWIEE
ncbi:DUF2806 domain-containing protein [Hoeflea sp. AS60]|uniref:DUF2806 domain-containing protein n=1 Tax=Hoeflea sp. AS60 TaxID=3135780 RepID=UPI00317BEA9E